MTERKPYGTESMFDEPEYEPDECHDCGAKPGELHMKGCDMEECPKCGGQLIGCSHAAVFLS